MVCEKLLEWCDSIWAEIECGPHDVKIKILGPNQRKHYVLYGKTSLDAITKAMQESWDKWDQEQEELGIPGYYDEEHIYRAKITDEELSAFRNRVAAKPEWDFLVKDFDTSIRDAKTEIAWTHRYYDFDC